jgi:cell division transport system ATP-binding protein
VVAKGVVPCKGRRVLRFADAGLAYAGVPVLSGLTFTLDPGSFTWLVGPSGAGKSSLLQLMGAGLPPSSGHVEIFGRDVLRLARRERPGLRRQIGIVWQEFRLLPHLSAFDNVALPLRIAGRPEPRILEDVAEMLDWVGLSGKLAARPAELSGGEQQRVAVARAVVSGPRLLLADEPTGNLDADAAERIVKLFQEMNRLGTGVVVATHSQTLVRRYPADVMQLDEGRLVPHG